MICATVIDFEMHGDSNGKLCVYERGKHFPFDIRRVFTVSAKEGDIRGEHAHKKCSQLLVCVSGRIRVSWDNGSVVSHQLLENMGSGILIPPGIWAKEEYLEDDSVLMVLCDRGYESEDYIRNYPEFIKL